MAGFRGVGCSCINEGDLAVRVFFCFPTTASFSRFVLFQMSVNARRHRLYSCLGGLVGYDVIASHATSLLHTQKVASSSLASSTFFFFFYPPMPLRRPTALFDRFWKKNFIKSCSEPVLPSPASKPLQSARGGVLASTNKKKIGDNTDLCIFRI